MQTFFGSVKKRSLARIGRELAEMRVFTRHAKRCAVFP
jgi:hypothetical protein